MFWGLRYTVYRSQRAKGWLLFRIWLVFLVFVVLTTVGLLLLRLMWASKVYAGSFYPNGDILYCDVIPALGVFVESISNMSDIVYDVSAVVGYPSVDIGLTHLKNYVDTRFARARRLDRATLVALPPGGRMALGVFLYNFSGRTVPIHGVYVPFKSSVGAPGKLLMLRGVNLQNRNIMFRYNGRYYGRNASWGYFPLPLELPNKVLSPGYKIGVFEVKAGLEVVKLEKDCELFPVAGGMVRGRICVKNLDWYNKTTQIYWGDERLGVLSLGAAGESNDNSCLDFHKRFSSTVELTADLGVLYIEDAAREECFSTGDTRGDSTNPLSRAVLLWRGERGAPPPGGAPQPSLARVGDKGICIRRIPYKISKDLGACQFTVGLPSITRVHKACTGVDNGTVSIDVTVVNNTTDIEGIPLAISPINFDKNDLAPLSPNVIDSSGEFITHIDLPQLTNKTITLVFKPSVGSKLYWLDQPIIDVELANNTRRTVLPRCTVPIISINEHCKDHEYIISTSIQPLEAVAQLKVELINIAEVTTYYKDGRSIHHRNNFVLSYNDLKRLEYFSIVSTINKCKGGVVLKYLDRLKNIRHMKEVPIDLCLCNSTPARGIGNSHNSGSSAQGSSVGHPLLVDLPYDRVVTKSPVYIREFNLDPSRYDLPDVAMGKDSSAYYSDQAKIISRSHVSHRENNQFVEDLTTSQIVLAFAGRDGSLILEYWILRIFFVSMALVSGIILRRLYITRRRQDGQ